MSTTSTILPSIFCVTGADIEHGEVYGADGKCPVGLALRRAFEALGVVVTDAMVVRRYAVIGTGMAYFVVDFPDEVNDFIEAFDEGYEVASFSFVPERIVRCVRVRPAWETTGLQSGRNF